jgi:hypothetical protein
MRRRQFMLCAAGFVAALGPATVQPEIRVSRTGEAARLNGR